MDKLPEGPKATISWTVAKLAMLKEQRDAAVAEGKDEFTFVERESPEQWSPVKGEHPMLVSYAKYLIEYLEGVFEANPTPPRQPNREGEEGQ